MPDYLSFLVEAMSVDFPWGSRLPGGDAAHAHALRTAATQDTRCDAVTVLHAHLTRLWMLGDRVDDPATLAVWREVLPVLTTVLGWDPIAVEDVWTGPRPSDSASPDLAFVP